MWQINYGKEASVTYANCNYGQCCYGKCYYGKRIMANETDPYIRPVCTVWVMVREKRNQTTTIYFFWTNYFKVFIFARFVWRWKWQRLKVSHSAFLLEVRGFVGNVLQIYSSEKSLNLDFDKLRILLGENNNLPDKPILFL